MTAVVVTDDVDLLVANEVPLTGPPVASRLIDAGYVGRYLEERHSQYYKFESRNRSGFEVEFLTPSPPEERRESLVVQSGLRAQALPGLDFLLTNKVEARVRDRVDNTAVNLTIGVPVPGAFILNKLFSYLNPIGGADRRKDIYYVFQAVRNLPLDKRATASEINACLDSRLITDLSSGLSPLFADEYSTGTRDIVNQLTDLDMPERDKRLLVYLEMNELLDAISS